MAYDSTNFDTANPTVAKEFQLNPQEEIPTVTVPPLTVPLEVQLLIKTRERIAQGWCQYSLYEHHGRGQFSYCSIGAFHNAAKDFNDFNCDKKKALLKIHNAMYPKIPVVGRLIGSRHISDSRNASVSTITRDIIAYNDAPRRKKKDVLKVLDKAITTR